MSKPLSRRPRLTAHERSIVALHGDILHGWFEDHFKGHPKALKRSECHDMIRYAVRDARNR